MDRPLIIGHSWGADVALEFAVANPGVPKGLCFVDGGMIQPSSRYSSLEDAREQMAPPIFAGVSLETFTQRVRSRRESAPASTRMRPEAEDAVLANFQVLPDNTIRAWLNRENHLRIILHTVASPPTAIVPPSFVSGIAVARPPTERGWCLGPAPQAGRDGGPGRQPAPAGKDGLA